MGIAQPVARPLLLRARHLAGSGGRAPVVVAAPPAAGAAALAAPLGTGGDAEHLFSYASLKSDRVPPVAPLPPPPASTNSWSVAAYLAKLALGERRMLWRVVLAFMFMVRCEKGAVRRLARGARMRGTRGARGGWRARGGGRAEQCGACGAPAHIHADLATACPCHRNPPGHQQVCRWALGGRSACANRPPCGQAAELGRGAHGLLCAVCACRRSRHWPA